jgi:FkbM family methyltransferase
MFRKTATSHISNMVHQHHGSRIIEFGAKLCQLYLRSYWNERYYALESNGELLVLNALAQVYGRGSGVVAFDVGANVGDYAERILQTMPEAKVHCFEIVPSIHEHLHTRWRCHPAVVVNGFGLSDQDADVDVTFYPDSPTEGRIHALRRDMRMEIVTSHVRPGDDYMADQGIDRVDFLKVDTEGHEMFVLRGFSKALSEGRVTTIQFEYGTTWLAARTLLRDVYDLLLPLGYKIGRLFPDGVRFKDYHLDDEHFRMGNYIAVKANREDLIRALEQWRF